MYGQETPRASAEPMVDWSVFRPTRFRLVAACALLLAVTLGVSLVQFSSARDNVLPGGSPVGGDYVAFYGAALLAAEGEAATAYDFEEYKAHLVEIGPPIEEDYNLSWQYPPTYFFLVLPFAFLPFVTGYVAWTGGAMALYFATLRAAGFGGLFLFAILAAPSTFQAAITGQNGFLTASLVAAAAYFPKSRPILAGLAAALLTVKPQLGILIPFAYLAAGCWRAFAVAAAGALALAAAATLVFGPEIWLAFIDGVGFASNNLAGGNFPENKMATPYAWFLGIGAPAAVAACFHAAFAAAAIACVVRIWRIAPENDLRAAVLCAAIFFAAPYGFYYELTILALPVAVLARRGLERGWPPLEQPLLAVLFLAPMLIPTTDPVFGVTYGFPYVALLAAAVLRRVELDHPGAVLGDWRKPVTPAAALT